MPALSSRNNDFIKKACAHLSNAKPMDDNLVREFMEGMYQASTDIPQVIMIDMEGSEEWSESIASVCGWGEIDCYNSHEEFTHIIYQLGDSIMLYINGEHGEYEGGLVKDTSRNTGSFYKLQ